MILLLTTFHIITQYLLHSFCFSPTELLLSLGYVNHSPTSGLFLLFSPLPEKFYQYIMVWSLPYFSPRISNYSSVKGYVGNIKVVSHLVFATTTQFCFYNPEAAIIYVIEWVWLHYYKTWFARIVCYICTICNTLQTSTFVKSWLTCGLLWK